MNRTHLITLENGFSQKKKSRIRRSIFSRGIIWNSFKVIFWPLDSFIFRRSHGIQREFCPNAPVRWPFPRKMGLPTTRILRLFLSSESLYATLQFSPLLNPVRSSTNSAVTWLSQIQIKDLTQIKSKTRRVRRRLTLGSLCPPTKMKKIQVYLLA